MGWFGDSSILKMPLCSLAGAYVTTLSNLEHHDVEDHKPFLSGMSLIVSTEPEKNLEFVCDSKMATTMKDFCGLFTLFDELYDATAYTIFDLNDHLTQTTDTIKTVECTANINVANECQDVTNTTRWGTAFMNMVRAASMAA